MCSCCPFIRGMKFHCFLNPPKWPFVLKFLSTEQQTLRESISHCSSSHLEREKGILLIAELVKWEEDSIASLQPVLLQVSKSPLLLSRGSPAIHGAARNAWNNLVNVHWRPKWKLLLLHQQRTVVLQEGKILGLQSWSFHSLPCPGLLIWPVYLVSQYVKLAEHIYSLSWDFSGICKLP